MRRDCTGIDHPRFRSWCTAKKRPAQRTLKRPQKETDSTCSRPSFSTAVPGRVREYTRRKAGSLRCWPAVRIEQVGPREKPAWRVYERVVACFEVEAADMDASVTPNASLVGAISAAPRQIDVLVDARWERGTERRIIFDAKWHGRKLTVQDVDAFVGLMLDVRAARGVVVCTNGWTEAAKNRADEVIKLRLMTVAEADEADHSAMEPCPHCRFLPREEEGCGFLGRTVPASPWGLGDRLHRESATSAGASRSGVGSAEKGRWCPMESTTSAAASGFGTWRARRTKRCSGSGLTMAMSRLTGVRSGR